MDTGIFGVNIPHPKAWYTYVIHRLGDPYWEKLSGGTQTKGTVSPNTDRPRPVNNFLFFSYLDLKVLRKFSFIFQPMCVEVGRIFVDEARDRLQTKTKHYNMMFSSLIYIVAPTTFF